MERKHQVFVSSTYKDLIEERKEVIHALLELDCIPAGMELFPATDEDAWSLIKEVIDGCDYYLLIIAGKYGSVNTEGIGYTEMEFDYAISQHKPVICFVHENIDDLKSNKVESTEIGKNRLNAFRDKAQSKHCKFWVSAHDLGGKVSRSLIQLRKKHPSDGWVPGQYAADQEMLSEMERLRTRIAELEVEALSRKDGKPSNYDELENGEDIHTLYANLYIDKKRQKKEVVFLEATWDKLFSYCGTELSGECSTEELAEKIRLAYFHSLPEEYDEFIHYSDIILQRICEDQIHVQFQALGLMESGIKKRAVSDNKTYWRLTPFGERYLIQIRALKKEL
ncbi:DUF4062 domain-containing protein [Pseudoalteromonas sp. 20-92]|uniref:DUF4062 domain-containing protein n=2 Tax=unclassified Pseudoalteromonas TaxID=194690 RepID=UPI0027B246C3|nr:DUF4062 domain-containing protein [Pseudoalteromonas sp. 20-92]MDQ2046105.1 DUF4062 domain-containing protein [Pseudoalteromonas sp. 20-92]